MNRKIASGGRAAGLAMILALAATTHQAAADWQSMPLVDLLGDAEHVALARVVEVVPGKTAGSQVATLELRGALKGDPGATFQLAGSTSDPGLPEFLQDTEVIAFFDLPKGEPGLAIGRDQGVAPVLPPQYGPTAQLLKLVLSNGKDVRLGEVLRFVTAGPPRVPQPVIAALLEQLDATATVQDRNAILRLSCRPDDFRRDAAALGIRLAGLLAIAEARGCLERHATTPQGTYAIDSVEALGNFADARSLPALLSLIPSMPPRPFEEGTDKPEEDGPGPAFDPEDEGTPKPDPWEESDDAPPQPRPEDAIDNGRDEPDKDVGDDDDANDGPVPPGAIEEDDDAPFDSDDLFARTADGGLTDAAVLALGKLGDSAAVPRLSALTREGDNLGLHSSVVTSLGLIGTQSARRELRLIANGHPNPLVRTLAQQTLERL
jgi:HEAT repeat protein